MIRFPSIRHRTPRRAGWERIAAAFVAASLLAPEPNQTALVLATEPVAQATGATIHLNNGDYATGQLADSPSTDSIAWRSAAFTAPFHFALDAVSSVHFPMHKNLPARPTEFRFELSGGDVVLGSLVSFDDDCFAVDAPNLQRLRVEKRIVRRILQSQAADLVFLGPNGLDGWQAIGPPAAWRDDGGQLLTSKQGAGLRRGFDLPPQVCFEFELAWNTDVDFELALGIGQELKPVTHAFRFEIQENRLVILKETGSEADIAVVQEIKPGSGRLHLRAFLDQVSGRLLVCSAAGKKLAELKLADERPASNGIQLINKKGDLRLERLCITRWGGEPPLVREGNMARAQTTEGTVVEGEFKAFDAETRQFVMNAPAGPQRIAAERVREIDFAAVDEVAKGSFSAIHHSGTRVSGKFLKVERNAVWLDCPGIREPVGSPIEDLQALLANHSSAPAPLAYGHKGRLELEGTKMIGWLVDGRDADGGCLVWHSSFSDVACPLARGVAGRIVYRDPPPPQPVAVKPSRPRGQGGGMALLFDRIAAVDPNLLPKANHKPSESVLHLRCGDTISATIAKIDEQGVTFASTSTEATFIPHGQLQAVELSPDAPPVKILKAKKDRLLTLPRMQRENAPTQLIRSVSGDYLRGRLVSMDDKQLQVEVRLETKTVPRSSVARILWLHPAADGATPASAPEAPTGTRVQALTAEPTGRSASRLTFVADQLAGTTLSGRSELLSKCQVELKLIDQLLIGPAIEQAASVLAFHQWTLQPAAEPRATGEGESGGEGQGGLESALIGKPAPEIELDLLGGGTFRLADYKNKVLVLDFWASWCGPCLRTMPLVEKVAREFADRDVRMVGINLEEGPDRVKLTVERLQIEMKVALDRDGRMAEKYGATAIPQTVIIDRQGKVVRLFVGGGAKFDDQLREALRGILAPEQPAKD